MDHMQILYRGRVILIYRTLGQPRIKMETAFEIGWITARGDPPIHRSGPDALKMDFDARMAISAELGHGREEEVTTVYPGR